MRWLRVAMHIRSATPHHLERRCFVCCAPKELKFAGNLAKTQSCRAKPLLFSKRRKTLRFFSRFERHDSFLFLLPVATSIDVTHVTSRFYKLPPFNVWGAVAHTYLLFFSERGVNGIAKTINPSIAQDRRKAELHGAMSFVSLRLREVELPPKGNF